MTKVIVCTSQKGGVAKTTTAVTIAHGLARAGHNVFLLDFDPQGHASIALGRDPEPDVYRFFVDGAEDVCAATDKVGLFLMSGNSRTRTADSVLRVESSAQQMIDQLSVFNCAFAYIVIDTPASGLFQEVAVRMATTLVIPVRCEALGLDGVAATVQLAAKVGKPEQTLILPTMFDKRLKEHQINLELLRRNYSGKLATAAIPARVAVAEASACGKTIWEYGNGSMADVQAAYTSLLEWLQ